MSFWSPFHRVCMAMMALAGLLWLTQCKSPTPSHPETEKVRQLVNHYFETWSKPDMEAYGQCFDSHARIFFKTQAGEILQQNLSDFLHGQKMSHLHTQELMTESPNDIQIMMDDQGAQALVTWTLKKGEELSHGTDLFTYVKTPQGWKILSLVFYEAPKKSPAP